MPSGHLSVQSALVSINRDTGNPVAVTQADDATDAVFALSGNTIRSWLELNSFANYRCPPLKGESRGG